MKQRAMCPRCHRRFGSSKLFFLFPVSWGGGEWGGRSMWVDGISVIEESESVRKTHFWLCCCRYERAVCEDKCALDPSSTRRSNSRIWDVCEMCAVQISHPAILCAVDFDSIPNMYSPCQAPTRTYRIYILGSTLGLWWGGWNRMTNEGRHVGRTGWERNRTSNDERKLVERREIINKRNLYPSRSFHFFSSFLRALRFFVIFFSALFRSSAELHTLLLAFWEI